MDCKELIFIDDLSAYIDMNMVRAGVVAIQNSGRFGDIVKSRVREPLFMESIASLTVQFLHEN